MNKFFITLLLLATTNFSFSQGLAPKSISSNDDVFKYEIGTRFWYGLNNTKFDYSNTGIAYGNTLGNPAATLDWKNAASNNLEIFGKVTNDSNGWFVKGLLGVGVSGGKNGTMQDTDYLLNQVTYSDTTSSADNNHNFYVGADIGKNFKFDKINLSPILGYYFWQTSLTSYGGTVNPVANNFCYSSNCFGIPGGLNVGNTLSSSISPIAYDTRVQSPKLGGAVEYLINDKFKVNLELDIYPFADITLSDYHNANSDRVQNGRPNGISRGVGIGYGGELFVNYAVQQNFDFGLGVRYVKFQLKNQDMSFNTQANGWYNQPNALQQLDIQQLGYVLSLTYKF